MNKKWIKIVGIASIVAVLGVAALGAVAYAQSSFGRMGFGPRGFHNDEGFAPGGFFEGETGDFFGRGPRDGGFAPGSFFEGGPGFDRGGFGPATEFAERGPGPRGPRGGVGGEVTAKTDTSLTVQNRDGDSITVNVNEDTRVMLAETQTEGSLDDVTIGSNIGVMGPRNDDGSVDARGIVVLPAGDMAGGRVTAVDGSTITVENPKDGAATIVTNDNTTFRLNRDEGGALSDVAVDKHVVAFGETQEDGSILARLVLIHDGPPPGDGERPGPRGPRGGVGGEVTAKTDTSLTVQNRDGDSITVNVNEDTRVMLAETQTEGSLDDVTVGSNIGVMGPRNDDGSVDARGIVVLPAGDMAGGRVTAVDGSTITVENPKDGAATIVTNDNTTFRLNRDEEGALSDVAVDKHVVAFGETQEDGSILARLVLIHDGPPPGHR